MTRFRFPWSFFSKNLFAKSFEGTLRIRMDETELKFWSTKKVFVKGDFGIEKLCVNDELVIS